MRLRGRGTSRAKGLVRVCICRMYLIDENTKQVSQLGEIHDRIGFEGAGGVRRRCGGEDRGVAGTKAFVGLQANRCS